MRRGRTLSIVFTSSLEVRRDGREDLSGARPETDTEAVTLGVAAEDDRVAVLRSSGWMGELG